MVLFEDILYIQRERLNGRSTLCTNGYGHTNTNTPDPVSISEVKRVWVRSVLRWGTTRETRDTVSVSFWN